MVRIPLVLPKFSPYRNGEFSLNRKLYATEIKVDFSNSEFFALQPVVRCKQTSDEWLQGWETQSCVKKKSHCRRLISFCLICFCHRFHHLLHHWSDFVVTYANFIGLTTLQWCFSFVLSIFIGDRRRFDFQSSGRIDANLQLLIGLETCVVQVRRTPLFCSPKGCMCLCITLVIEVCSLPAHRCTERADPSLSRQRRSILESTLSRICSSCTNLSSWTHVWELRKSWRLQTFSKIDRLCVGGGGPALSLDFTCQASLDWRRCFGYNLLPCLFICVSLFVFKN